jgi:hypothetical protein
VAVISLEGKRKHSSLAGDFDPGAFADTITYLKVRLGVVNGPQRMKVAYLGPAAQKQSCAIEAEGPWQRVTVRRA